MSNDDIIYQSKGALIAFLGEYGFLTSSTGAQISGTPSDNEVAVWTNATTIEGDANFTWDGSTLDVGGALTVDGNTTLGNASGDSVTINAQTIALSNVDTGTDNTVLVYDGSSIVTDEIDSKVWAGDLVDYTGTPADNQLAIWTDTDTLEGDSGIIYNSGYFTIFPDSNVYATLGKTTDTNTEYARLNLKANANSTAVIGLLDARDSAVFGGMQLGTTSDHAIRVYQNNGYAMVIESDKSIGMAGNLGVSGSATLSGDLTVSGNDIKGSGGTAITMDGSNNVTLQNYVTIEEALRVNGDIIRNSTGTDVIAFEGGCVSLPTGLSSSMGTSITGTDTSANAFEWVKVAEFITTGLNNYATAVIDVMLAGYDTTAEIYQARVHLRAKANTTSYSICQVDIIQDVGSEAWGTADFVLTQKTSTAYQGQLWVNSAASLQRCYATITNGSNDGQSNYKADWYLTPGQMWGSYASLGSDVTTINVKKRFDSLGIDGNLQVTGSATIAQESWNAPSYAGSWANYGGAYINGGYMIDSMGFIHLRGLIKTTGTGLPIFTLPSGYRPSAQLIFTVQYYDYGVGYVNGRVDVTSAGVVQVSFPTPASGDWVSLTGLSFDTQ